MVIVKHRVTERVVATEKVEFDEYMCPVCKTLYGTMEAALACTSQAAKPFNTIPLEVGDVFGETDRSRFDSGEEQYYVITGFDAHGHKIFPLVLHLNRQFNGYREPIVPQLYTDKLEMVNNLHDIECVKNIRENLGQTIALYDAVEKSEYTYKHRDNYAKE